MIRFVIALFLGISIQSCMSTDMHVVNEKLYFDIPEYIQTQEKNGIAEKLHIEKTVVFEEQIEKKLVSFAEYDSSLQLLVDFNLNKESYAGKVEEDTVYNNDKSFTIHYEVTDSDLPILASSVHMAMDTVLQLSVITQEKNLLYTTRKEYNYIPGKELRIEILQKTIFYAEKKYSLHYKIQ